MHIIMPMKTLPRNTGMVILSLFFIDYGSVNVAMRTTVALSSDRVVRIPEGVPPGTVVIPNLIEFLNRQSTSLGDNSPDTLLAIGNAAMPGVSWFAIDPKRRSLFVQTTPDRELLCPVTFILPANALHSEPRLIEFQSSATIPSRSNTVSSDEPHECVLKVSIVHGSTSNPSFSIVFVIIEDINDHAPTFNVIGSPNQQQNEYVLKVKESSKSSVDSIHIPLPLAHDPDSGTNGLRGYRIGGEDAYMFRLKIGTSLEFSEGGSVSSGKPPLVATDTSHAYRSKHVNQLWLIPIQHANPNAMSPTAAAELDREFRSQYRFTLVAYDGGSPKRSGTLSIRLVVEDVNDHSPSFNQPMYSGKVAENDPPGTVVFEFSAQDADSEPHNGNVRFRIPGEAQPNMNQLNSQQEKDPRIVGLSESQIAAARYFAIEYTEQDTRKFHPNFTMGRLIVRRQNKEKMRKYASEAIDSARRSKFINSAPELAALDLDISGQQGSGVRLEFLIEAYDQGSPKSLSTRVPVYVMITDVNDHQPIIFVSYLKPASKSPQLPFESSTMYHQTMGSNWGWLKEGLDRAMVAQITVTDEDALVASEEIVCSLNDSRFSLEDITTHGGIGKVLLTPWIGPQFDHSSSWSPISRGNSGTHPQTLTTRMFKLMANTPLDREASNNPATLIQLELYCKDNAQGQRPGGELTSHKTIQIMLEDINDNPPVFDHVQYTFHVPENRPVSSTDMKKLYMKPERYFIGRLHATDADEGANAQVEYHLSPTATSSVFLDRVTGDLYVVNPFDRESVGEITFQVIAVDSNRNGSKADGGASGVQLTGTANVRLIVDDVNDSPPIFQETNYHFEVEEGVDLVKIGTVRATDADQGESERISYRIAISKDFQLKHPGEISNRNTISRQFPNRDLEITSHFQIDPVTGVLHLKSRLDREKRDHYEFNVLAVDNPRAIPNKHPSSGGTARTRMEIVQFTATATVLVTVLDRNDNPPTILSPENYAEFTLRPEQVILGNNVFEIHATDPDLGENGTIEYRLLRVEDESLRRSRDEGGDVKTYVLRENTTQTTYGIESTNESPFAIDGTAGICYIREDLPASDSDITKTYLLRIQVHDLGRPIHLNSTLLVRVIKQSINDDTQNAFMNVNGEDHSIYGAKHVTDGNNQYNDGLTNRITDRTMVIILSTVFVLLLLTTIVLLLLVRYRKIFLRNLSFESANVNESPLAKANVGFTAGRSNFDRAGIIFRFKQHSIKRQ